MEIVRTLIVVLIVLAGACLILGLANMSGVVGTAYRISPGGWLNGAQTLLLFAVALYCYGRALRM